MYLSVFFMPQVGFILAIFSPVPLLFYLENKGREKISDIIFVVAIVAMVAFITIPAIYYIFSVLFMSITIVYCHRNNFHKSWLPIVLSPAPIVLAFFAAGYLIPPIRDSLTADVKQKLLMMIDIIEKSGADYGNYFYIPEIKKNIDLASKTAVMMFPAFNFVYISLSAFAAKKFYIVKRGEQEMPFRMPDNVVWGLIVAFAMLFFGGNFIQTLGFNITIIYGMLYFYQGFWVITGVFNKFNVPAFVRFIIYLFLFSQLFLAISVALIGLFSIWIKLPAKKNENEGE